MISESQRLLQNSLLVLRNGGVSALRTKVERYLVKEYLYPMIIWKNIQSTKFRYINESVSYPYKRIWVDPRDIQLCGLDYHTAQNISINRFVNTGQVISGDWDMEENCLQLIDEPKYLAVIQHFEKGVPWDETELFSQLEQYIEQYGSFDGCFSYEDAVHRYETDIETLYMSIKNGGYKSQKELQSSQNDHVNLREVGVSIGRNGQYVFGGGGGWHRLAISSVLGIDEIPVHVIIRHRYWQEYRESVIRGEEAETDHPDLRDLTDHT